MKRKYLVFLLAFLLMLYVMPAVSAYDNVSPDSITFFSETLPDDYMFYPDNETHGTGYADDFTDVSDWVQAVGEDWGNDGDLVHFDVPNDAGGDVYYSDSPSLPAGSYYWEFRGFSNTSYGDKPVSLSIYSGDGRTGNALWMGNYYYTPTGNTRKNVITFAYDIECVVIALLVPVAAGGPAKFSFDYLRISPADEMGWQHDGSTTEGITEQVGITVSSDGDFLNVSTVDAFEYFSVFTDTTATKAYIEPDYYPFLHLRFTPDSIGERFAIYLVYTGGSFALQPEISIAQQDYYYNMRAVTANDIQSLNIYAFSAYDPYYIDYIKFYSIANYMVTQSASCSSSDIVYVDSNDNLVFDRATTNWLVLETLYTNITTASYPIWNITRSGTLGFGIRMRGGPSYAWGTAVYGTTRGVTAELISVFDPFIIMIQIHSQSVVGVCTFSEIKFIEEITMQDINWFNELFLSTDIWGWFGPIGILVISFLILTNRKLKPLGFVFILLQLLIISQYVLLVAVTPWYWWNIIILVLGMLLCIGQMTR